MKPERSLKSKIPNRAKHKRFRSPKFLSTITSSIINIVIKGSGSSRRDVENIKIADSAIRTL